MAENTVPAPSSPASSSLNSLLDRLLTEAETSSADGSEASPPPPEATPSESLPTGSILQNPALLSALPTLMENLSPLLRGLGSGVGSAPNATRPHSIDRHTALLCAIKPYLSPHRRDAAETVLRLCKVWDALERSGISPMGLLGSLGRGGDETEGRNDDVQ